MLPFQRKKKLFLGLISDIHALVSKRRAILFITSSPLNLQSGRKQQPRDEAAKTASQSMPVKGGVVRRWDAGTSKALRSVQPAAQRVRLAVAPGA